MNSLLQWTKTSELHPYFCNSENFLIQLPYVQWPYENGLRWTSTHTGTFAFVSEASWCPNFGSIPPLDFYPSDNKRHRLYELTIDRSLGIGARRFLCLLLKSERDLTHKILPTLLRSTAISFLFSTRDFTKIRCPQNTLVGTLETPRGFSTYIKKTSKSWLPLKIMTNICCTNYSIHQSVKTQNAQF